MVPYAFKLLGFSFIPDMGSAGLVDAVERLKKTGVRKLVCARVNEFEKAGRSPIEKIFSELCFCILTANYNAERAIKIQDTIGRGFLTLPEKKLSQKLRELGHRYPNTRAAYVVEARKSLCRMEKALKSLKGEELRGWLVENVKGIGYKEASHFLRNIGYKDYAIIDFHIIGVLVEHNLIKKPKTLSKKRYLEVEELLRDIAKECRLNLAELDLYLWYMETGKVLK